MFPGPGGYAVITHHDFGSVDGRIFETKEQAGNGRKGMTARVRPKNQLLKVGLDKRWNG